MPESAGLQQETAAPGEQLPTLLFKPGFIPVPELNIPSGSCLCSAAPFAAGNCLLSAAVGSARLPSAPDSLPERQGGQQPLCPYVLQHWGGMELKPFQPAFLLTF